MNLKTVACCALTLRLAAPSARAQSASMPTTLTGLALPGVTVTLTTKDHGTTGTLAEIPIHAAYQPRWWLDVQLFLDDATHF